MNDVRTDEIVKDIKERTKDLMFLSESEFPVEVYCCDTEEPVLNHLMQISGRSTAETIEEISLSFLFKNINTLQGNENLGEEENSKRYRDLINYLTERLNNLKVYTMGEGQVDVFITGATESGKYITLATKSFE
jgi:hypothetical protein